MARGGILRKIATEVLGEEKAKQVWQRIDLIGDIAIVKKPPGVGIEELRLLAEKLLENISYIRSVWAASSPVEGEYRLRDFVFLAGEERSETIYREHGCRFLVDIRRVYISPRLSYEHYRVAKQVEEGEIIVNMYAGVGGFSIVAARHAQPRKVYSIDINPDAFYYMARSIELNHVEDKVVPLLGDATVIVESHLRGIADRVIMPLPEKAIEHLPYAVDALRVSGKRIIHIYLHIGVPRGENPEKKAIEAVEARAREIGVEARPIHTRIVRPIGPRRYQVVVDTRVYP